MAPAIVETTQVQEEVRLPAKRIPEGFNKEFYRSKEEYSREAEEKGTERHPPASYPNYLPVWDNEKGQKSVARLRQDIDL